VVGSGLIVGGETAGRMSAPYLKATSVLAECRVGGVSPVGDHEVVLGEVVNTVLHTLPPLLYGMRRLSTW